MAVRTDHSAIAPGNVATNIVEKWTRCMPPPPRGKAGKLGGKYETLRPDTPGSTGARWKYSADSGVNSVVPGVRVADIAAVEKKFTAGDLKSR